MIEGQTRSGQFVSFFSGCGGFDLGFMQAGFQCAAAFDVDPVAVQNYNENLGNYAAIRDLRFGHVPSLSVSNIDVVLAGSPCQGFSTAGKRKVDDPRNELLLTAAKLAVTVNPKLILLENVPAVQAGVQRHYWDGAKDILIQHGYSCSTLMLSGSHFGIAQMRKRVVLIGTKRRINLADLKLPPLTLTPLREALSGLKRAANHDKIILDKKSRAGVIARKIRQGQKLCNVRRGATAVHTWQIPEVFGETTARERTLLAEIIQLRRTERLREIGDADPVSSRIIQSRFQWKVNDVIACLVKKGYLKRVNHRYDLTHTFNGKYRRLSWDRPAYTVDTRFGDPRLFLHPEEQRGFTAREAARIQGFPDQYKFSGSGRQIFTMIGNAVPPPMAKWLAEFTLAVLKGD